MNIFLQILKLKTMKNLNIISAIALSVIFFTACEKEGIEQQSGKSLKSPTKSKTNQTKSSGDDLPILLGDFFDDVINDSTPEPLQVLDGLAFTESALNFTMNHLIGKDDSEFPLHQDVFFVDNIDISSFQSVDTIGGSDLLSFYNGVYNIVDNLADTAVMEDGSGDKFITGVDIVYDEADLSQGAGLMVTLGRNWTPSNTISCSFVGDYFIKDNMGGCNDHGNAGTLTNLDANDMVSRHVSNPFCNPHIDRCTTYEHYPFTSWIYVKTSPSGPPNYSFSKMATLWNFYETTNPNDCVTESDQEQTAIDIENWHDNNFPDYSPPKGTFTVKNVFTKNNKYIDNDPQQTLYYTIQKYTTDGVCTAVQISHRPGLPTYN